RFADELATRAELKAARRCAHSCEATAAGLDAYEAAEATARATAYRVRILTIDDQGPDPILAGYDTHTATANRLAGEQSQEQGKLLRDICGNPFRRVALAPAVLTWQGGAAVKMALAIYDQRRFEDLPVLADALEDAGCASADILAHLRGPGPHVRGCWA